MGQKPACPKTIPPEVFSELCSQGYHIVGTHSANKRCMWLRECLRGGEFCYKHKFYGISSHRCVQCTPVLLFCNHACKFCWRIMPEAKEKFEEMPTASFKWDSPQEIAEGLLKAQKDIVSGYGGNEKTTAKLCEESRSPKHIALSLTGEPTLYPYLGELIGEFHKRGLTTFLVTNGTTPQALQALSSLPTQLYISMAAPNKEIYLQTCRPQTPSLWENYCKSLQLMGGKRIREGTRTVLRMTLVRSLNMGGIDGYAKQIAIARPMFVEVKSYMHVGKGREKRGLALGDMLSMQEIWEYAQNLAKLTGYLYTDEHPISRVALLCRDKKAQKGRFLKV
ncbi:tRNA-modifying enzyme [Candidatus Micrarchaeota archaeon CG1_02_47_40]|nr:MAG: tRNA-modifying enzyme [Candidatus Micrarchaeota archaeon CG1_02_47_40]